MTVDDFTVLWWRRAMARELTAVVSLLLIPLIAAALVIHHIINAWRADR
jgi:hypothetical protein